MAQPDAGIALRVGPSRKGSSRPIIRLDYDYDANGRITAIDDALNSGRSSE